MREPSWIYHYITPLLGKVFDDEIIMRLDFPAPKSTKRPDIQYIYVPPKGITRTLLIGEIKTPDAPNGERAKEMSRLIRRGIDCLKVDIEHFDHKSSAPTIFLMRFDGLQTSIFELTLWKGIFLCHEIGNFKLITALFEKEEHAIADAVIIAEALLVYGGRKDRPGYSAPGD
ncbi:hypothetical protein HDU86_000879 [Geranomyces michiganensis]|nr:hypothetical protein HDU86_000879 [Geranomyces michiganensis]